MDKMNTCYSALHVVNVMNKGNLKDDILKQNYEIMEVVQDKYARPTRNTC